MMDKHIGLGIDPIPGIPMVKVVDENGKELFRGWYIYYKMRQCCVIDDELREDDVQHLVAYSKSADWNMPRDLGIRVITSPHKIEVIEERDTC